MSDTAKEPKRPNAPDHGQAADKKQPPNTLPPQAPGWSTPTFIAGIIVGLMLISGGLAVQALGLVLGPQSMLIVCSGLGIILGAFGAVAVIRYQGLVIAGVAAVAMALYFVVDHEASRHVMISVSDIPETMTAGLYIDGDVPAVRSQKDQYDFYLIGPEMRASFFRLELTGKDPVSGMDSELLFKCIPAKYLRPHLASGKTLQWRVNTATQELQIDSERIGQGCIQTVAEGSPGSNVLNLLAGLLVTPAMAQATLEPIETYLDDLNSPEPAVRRFARDGLAQWGVAAVEPMMELWRSDPSNYRNTLGVAVALTEFLRNNKDQREAVSEKLKREDLSLLTDALDHSDRTMRIYATEFLYDLGDPEVTSIVLDKFPQMNQDGQYNSAFVLQNVVPFIDASTKAELKNDLEVYASSNDIGPNTKEQMQKLLVDLNG